MTLCKCYSPPISLHSFHHHENHSSLILCSHNFISELIINYFNLVLQKEEENTQLRF